MSGSQGLRVSDLRVPGCQGLRVSGLRVPGCQGLSGPPHVDAYALNPPPPPPPCPPPADQGQLPWLRECGHDHLQPGIWRGGAPAGQLMHHASTSVQGMEGVIRSHGPMARVNAVPHHPVDVAPSSGVPFSVVPFSVVPPCLPVRYRLTLYSVVLEIMFLVSVDPSSLWPHSGHTLAVLRSHSGHTLATLWPRCIMCVQVCAWYMCAGVCQVHV